MQNNGIILVTTIFVAIFMIVCFSFMVPAFYDWQKEYEYQQSLTEQAQADCDHDWVITSEFNLLWKSYRTVSKCSKCGKVIR